MAQSDFTHADDLGVMIAGKAFPHLLYRFVMVYSRWEHVGVVLGGESFKALAENLQQANRVVREEMERGVFDIESVRAANETLIATIEDSLRIADEGKARRAAAETNLKKLEIDLRDTLAAARARGTEATTPPPT